MDSNRKLNSSDGMTGLGKLICDANPYTENAEVRNVGALRTGEMHGFNSSGQIEVEVEANYPAQWAFKGQQQKRQHRPARQISPSYPR